jgi:hypothetical protein
MKKTLLLLVAVLFVHLSVPKVQAAPDVSIDFFYDQLGDYGDWVEVGDYGYGWQPRDVDPDWRPYSDGRWAYTDAGWTWISEEPYGWAVYHYGRWTQLEDRGWVWIPGTEWAPAWVSWRSSPQHVGWAPLPPEATFRREVGFSGWVDNYYDIGPGAYRFVETRNFGAPRLRTVFVEPRENITIIRQTTNITQITYVNNEVNNGGPRFEEISRVSSEPVRRLHLERRREIEGDRTSFRGEQMRAQVEGDSLRVFSPGFNARPAAPPTRVTAKIQNVQVNHGWKDAGPAADVEQFRSKVRTEAKAPKGLPPKPKFEKLAVQAAAAPDAAPAPESVAPTAPANKPRGGKVKDPRTGKMVPAPGAPVDPAATPTAEAKTAPAESPSTTAAPVKPQKPVRPGKAGKSPATPAPDAPTAPAAADSKPEQVPPAAEPGNPVPARKGSNRKQPGMPQPPTPPQADEPRTAPSIPEAPGDRPPAPDQPSSRKQRPVPPAHAPGLDAPNAPRTEPRMPKAERPETARDLPPAAERPRADRPVPSAGAPGGAAPQVAPRKPEGPRPGKAPKGDKKLDDDAPKPQ